MSVISAAMLRPHDLPILTMFSASLRASSGVFMKAPLPTFTSSTMLREPEASFFDMMLEVISGIESTVAVTSLRA